MEGRKRWVIQSIGFNVEATYLTGMVEANAPSMYWTGRDTYPMWAFDLKDAVIFDVKDAADSAAFLFVAKHHEWFGRVKVHGYMEYGPKIGEAGEA